MKLKILIRTISCIFILLIAIKPHHVLADVMSSSNFKIFSDVLSVGGVYSTSANYGIFDALSEIATNPTSSSSSNFQVQNGFLGMSSSSIVSVNLSTNTVDLGILSITQVNTATQTVTVTTNSFTGYTTTIQTDHDLSHGSDVLVAMAGGSVVAGTPGYGVITSGTDGQMNITGGTITISPQTLAQSAVAIFADQTTVTYKASISQATAAGAYSQTVTFTTTANF